MDSCSIAGSKHFLSPELLTALLTQREKKTLAFAKERIFEFHKYPTLLRYDSPRPFF